LFESKHQHVNEAAIQHLIAEDDWRKTFQVFKTWKVFSFEKYAALQRLVSKPVHSHYIY
jgi:hypothetical protein